MPKLTEPQKEFIVTRYALYDTNRMIIDGFHEAFGIALNKQQVDNYNPEGRRAVAVVNGQATISKRLMELFKATRARFHETIDDIPIANKAYRLRRLNGMFEDAQRKGAVVVAAGLLEQAAKEVGETFSNKREVKHSGKIETTPGDELSVEDKREALAARLVDAFAEAKRSVH